MDSTCILGPEEELILCCAHTEIGPLSEEKIFSLVNADLDWEYIMNFAEVHKLKPILYWNLNRLHVNLPTSINDKLRNYFNKNIQKNLLLFAELKRLLELINFNGIIAIPYKGPVLAIKTYSNLGLREFNDLDIYIDKQDVINVKEILLSEGYKPKIKLKMSEVVKFIKTHRELKFFKNGFAVEIHWNFHGLFFSLPKDQQVWDENKKILIDLGSFSVINPQFDDLFLILCQHNAWHRWSRLSWLVDINELINSEHINWSEIIIKSEKLHMKRIILINLCLSNFFFGTELPKEIISEIKNDNKLKIIQKYFVQRIIKGGVSKNLLEELFTTIKLRDNYYYGLKDVIKSIITPGTPEWDQFHFPYFLWSLYYVFRPFNLLIKYKWK
ncbi:nucleotidyltransferase domain-containing protein [Methanobacterium formicicum]|uniref:nucleotidyltransferase domain-containing protein n=1 Tax=Methanobacterium formicicum TaxID=2162 RepID=UPI002412AEB5|nr:nucleotidyltransferase family protein [Methanobacterium formicicum]MDG3547072.1 nucleotidyltransferase family protein [Methanobacterium formicicum]